MKNSTASGDRAAALPVMGRCAHNLAAILVVAITAVSTAVLAAILRSTFYILQKQTLATYYRTVDSSSSHIFDVFESASTPQKFPLDSHDNHDQLHLNLVFVLDFWERMINIQSGLRRLVNIGVESGFTVVEPFMYESRIQPTYSDPHHFTARNMTPQPAMHYFQTEDLFFTNSYISYKEGIRRLELAEGLEKSTTKSYVIQAAVYFDWPDAISKQEPEKRTESIVPFRWCDDKLYSMVASNIGYMLSRSTFIERAVCLSVPHTISPHFFHSLFEFVRNGTKINNRRCSKCVAIALMNYRKHVFQGFHSNLGTQPFKQKVPPLGVSAFGRDMSKRVITEALGKRPYVAIQIRTGKAFTLFENYENNLLKQGVNITRYSSFKFWLRNCTRIISSEAKAQRRLLGRRAVYYIASDMFNEGWKGGENCPEEVGRALDEAKRYLLEKLHPIYKFDHTLFGVEQDVMGTSGIVDAAVSVMADRFLFARPSNFGRWVAEQRELNGKGEVVRINCTDERLHDE